MKNEKFMKNKLRGCFSEIFVFRLVFELVSPLIFHEKQNEKQFEKRTKNVTVNYTIDSPTVQTLLLFWERRFPEQVFFCKKVTNILGKLTGVDQEGDYIDDDLDMI